MYKGMAGKHYARVRNALKSQGGNPAARGFLRRVANVAQNRGQGAANQGAALAVAAESAKPQPMLAADSPRNPTARKIPAW